MVAEGQAHLESHKSEEGFPHMGDELGARSETISSGRPKFLKMWLNVHSAVSKAQESLEGGKTCMLLRSDQLLPGHKYCCQSWGDQSQNQFQYGTRAVVGLAVARVCLPGGVGESSTWHRLSSCGRTG